MAIKPVIVGTNGSAASARAVAWAIQEAVRRDVPLRIVAALPLSRHDNWLGPADSLYGALRETAVHALDEAADSVSLAAPELTVDTSLVIGEPGPMLAGLSPSASMLVVGERGTATHRTGQLGAVSRYLATHARCPVVVAPPQTPQRTITRSRWPSEIQMTQRRRLPSPSKKPTAAVHPSSWSRFSAGPRSVKSPSKAAMLRS
jgi:nucleotide-binding universal stress UspA family protein